MDAGSDACRGLLLQPSSAWHLHVVIEVIDGKTFAQFLDGFNARPEHWPRVCKKRRVNTDPNTRALILPGCYHVRERFVSKPACAFDQEMPHQGNLPIAHPQTLGIMDEDVVAHST